MGVASTAGASRWRSPQECLNEDVLKIISRKFRGWNNTLPYFFIVQGPLAGFVPYRTQHSVPLTIFQVFLGRRQFLVFIRIRAGVFSYFKKKTDRICNCCNYLRGKTPQDLL